MITQERLKQLLHYDRAAQFNEDEQSVFDAKRIELVGDYLNGRNGKPHLSGPKVAKKLKISTASIYAFWKQSGRGRFVRKQAKD